MLRSEQACSNCYNLGRPRRAGANYVCQEGPPTLSWVVIPVQENVLDPNSVTMKVTPCSGWPTTDPGAWCGKWRPLESQ
jgi:hypothetical protein